MASRLEAALAAGDWAQAAQVHQEEGRPVEAARLWERLLDFRAAAVAFREAGLPVEALRSAVRSRVGEAEQASLVALLAGGAPGQVVAAAEAMEAEDRPDLAGPLWEVAGEPRRAAAAFESAGELPRAACCLLSAGDQRGAGRVLQRRLAEVPGDHASALTLARVLQHFGREAEAAPLLRAATGDPHAGEQALVLLAVSLARQQMPYAADRVLEELRARFPSSSAALTPVADLAARAPGGGPGGPERVAGRYRVLSPRAASSLGDTYLAHDELEGRRVCLTLFRPQLAGTALMRDFARVARASGSLGLSQVLRVVQVDDQAGFMVTALPRGPSLEEWLEGGGRPPVDAAVRHAGVALGHLHRRGCCHGALNLTNVFVTAEGEVEVGEVGAGILAPLRETESVGLQASLAMLAPEVMAGAEPGPAADQYALAAVAYRLVTSRAPVPSEVPGYRPPSAWDRAAAPLDAPLARALAGRPEDRFQSVQAFLGALPGLGGLAPPAAVQRESVTAGAGGMRFRAVGAPGGRGEVRWVEAVDDVLGRRVAQGQGPVGALRGLVPWTSLAAGTDPVLHLSSDHGRCVVGVSRDVDLPGPLEVAVGLADAGAALAALHAAGWCLGPDQEGRLPGRGPVRLRVAGLPPPQPATGEGISRDLRWFQERVEALGQGGCIHGATPADLRGVVAALGGRIRELAARPGGDEGGGEGGGEEIQRLRACLARSTEGP